VLRRGVIHTVLKVTVKVLHFKIIDYSFYTFICLYFTFTTVLDYCHYLLFHLSGKILYYRKRRALFRHILLKITV